jgi:NB-ARC domain-containing protein
MYRCMRAIPQDALDPDQFKQVQEFFKQFEAVKGEHPGLYQTFDTAEAFEKLLLNNLQTLLLDYGERLKGAPVSPEVVRAHAPRIPDNLPRRAPFFGRDKDLGAALRALSPADRTWGVLVDGIGGIGKTTLAVEAAYRCKEKERFAAFVFVSAKLDRLDPDGIRTLTAAARTLEEFLNETARILGQPGIAQLAGDAKRQALLDTLRSTRTLLVYDNLETLSKEEQEAMAVWLRELPQDCKAIVTSRRRGGEGGVWLRLEKLEWDAARGIIENEMKRDAQLATKLNRAGAARWNELYDETKGSPLALMHILGLLRVRAALTFEGALDLLRGNRDPDLQKFIFQQARRELTANDEAALRALSLFTPSATFDSWAEVGTLSRNALETTIDRLSALSLVDVLAGEERYALHPLTRNFVRDELLAEPNVAQDTGMRFARYWVAYAQRSGGGVENYKTFNLLEAEWPNLEAAAEWLGQRAAVRGANVGDQQAARMLNDVVSALGQFLWFGGRWDERVRLNSLAYEAMRATNEWSAAGYRASDAAWIYGPYARDLPGESGLWTERAVEAWTQGGGKHERAVGLRRRGLAA